ncbi:hillarin-like [Pollicipes pollicipes]|uniref:hillarin-like n=1 Tax=Pollicipes pollicipes TaxID=41117 RepID=UPI001884A9BB|nr:hillarin-like [Pollicipes pollicipes]
MGCGRSRVSDEAEEVRLVTGSSAGSHAPREAWVSEKLHALPLLQPLLQPMGAMRGRKTTAVQKMENQAQTDSAFNEDEFDWDLSDKSDVETQTYRLPHQVACDVSVQTDTRTAGTQTVVQRVSRVTQTEPPQLSPASRTVTRHGSPTPSASVSAALAMLEAPPAVDFESQVNMAAETSVIKECQTNGREMASPAGRLHHSLRRSLDLDDATSLHEILTDNDFLTDEAPEYAAVPPPCKKLELVGDETLFDEVDDWVLTTPEKLAGDLTQLAVHLVTPCGDDDLLKARAIFYWIVNNIRFDWSLLDSRLDAADVLLRRAGVCREYVLLFSELCDKVGLRAKRLHGFAKNHDYKPGHHFRPKEDATHAWSAVFVRGSWRLVDCTWGAGFTDTAGQFVPRVNEFYFLSDPEDLGWTHFPFDDSEKDYDRWQLLVLPQTLEEFNRLPKVTPWFFMNELRLKRMYECPVSFKHQTEVEIFCHGPFMRFKYKFYSVSEIESSELNGFVFCQLRGSERRLASFTVQPPESGSYFLKVYGRPEEDIMDDETLPLDHLATFLLHCEKPRRQFSPWPVSDIPWGPTGFFYEMGVSLFNQDGPVIVTWGGFKQLVLETKTDLLTMVQIFDADGLEIESKSIVKRKDVDGDIIFFIHPPRIGFYKMLLYGMPRPSEKGKWRLPLISSFLIDSKLSRSDGEPAKDDDVVAKKKTIRLKPRAR